MDTNQNNNNTPEVNTKETFAASDAQQTPLTDENQKDDERLKQVNNLFEENQKAPENTNIYENAINGQFNQTNVETNADLNKQPIPEINSPTIIVSNHENKTPKWFYFVFAVTFVIFIIVTFLLVTTYLKNGTNLSLLNFGKQAATPTPKILPTNSPTPVVVKEIEDPAITSLKTLNPSDEISAISDDITKTDTKSIDEILEIYDKNFGIETEK